MKEGRTGIHNFKQVSYKVQIALLMLLRGRQSGGINAGCPWRANNGGPYARINARPLLSSLPTYSKFYNLGLAFRQKEEDEDDDGNNSQERDEGKGVMTTTTTTVAMGGIMLKENETGTLLWAVATPMAPPNVSSAPCRCTTRERLGSLEIYSAE
jgi:hypothetical protein